MKRNSLFIFALLIGAASTFAQNEISTLNVRGEASMNVRPTQSVVTFNITETKMSYAESIEGLSTRVSLLSKSLQKAGFKEQDIKTSNFNIQKNIVYDKGQREEKGFIASQTVRVTFVQDKDQLIKTLNEAANSKANAEIQISFELSPADQKRFQNDLIKLAVADAHAKANIIVDASSYGVSGIKTINYSESDFGRPPIAYKNMAAMESSIGVAGIEAADLQLNESVDITFIIEKK